MRDQDKPVRVFRNWKRDCYNIMRDGRVLASAKQVRLTAVEFLVRESGRQRMLRQGRRNVHAYAIGRLVDYTHPGDLRDLDKLAGRAVFYNPYRCSTFVDDESGCSVTHAAQAHLDEGGITYTD